MFSSSVLPWQQNTLGQLLAMYRVNRLPHALMLAGPEGCGKRIFAATIASILLCRKVDTETTTMAPCGNCDGCALVQAGSHGDMRWLMPEEGKRAIGVEPIREAIRFVQQTAGYGSHKVLVITPAEVMTTAAANALLKTLEEPAGDSFICLVSHRPNDLPVTVRSRCQTLAFPAPPVEESLAWLRHTLPSSDKADIALQMSDGRPLEAFRLATTETLDEIARIRDVLADLVDQKLSVVTAVQLLGTADVEAILASAAAVVQRKLKADLSLGHLSSHRQLFILRDDIDRWSSSIRRGVNLARDGLVTHLCNLLYTAGRARV